MNFTYNNYITNIINADNGGVGEHRCVLKWRLERTVTWFGSWLRHSRLQLSDDSWLVDDNYKLLQSLIWGFLITSTSENRVIGEGHQ
jgi:hypothetical protein